MLHDFDKAGFSILGTLSSSNRRYEFEHEIKVIDLGLRLTDVEAFGLEDRYEDTHDQGDLASRRANMRRNGATAEEADTLLDKRIELNALASDELVRFIEQKLVQNGIKKIVPNKDRLTEACRLFARSTRIKKIIDETLAKHEGDEANVPDDLEDQVRKYLDANPGPLGRCHQRDRVQRRGTRMNRRAATLMRGRPCSAGAPGYLHRRRGS